MIQEGMELNGYRIIEKIGEGGMGTVYKSYDLNLERYVALKAIHNYLTTSDDIVARFKQEARIQASLIHPNIISLFNLFQYGGSYFMVMEYVDGETLSKRIKRFGLLPPHKCIPMFIQILQAVDFAHQRGIVHRDLKPSNIMILKDDSIKVMDFGISKIVSDRSLTKTGTRMGTIYYSSPEQIKGEKNIDHRSDIYSLGITFFEMLTGHLPYNINTESDYIIMQQILEVKIPSVRKYYPYVPDKVDDAIQKATMKNPDERFQNCQEFIDFIKFEKIDEKEKVVKKEISTPQNESFRKIETSDIDKNSIIEFESISSNTYVYQKIKAHRGKRVIAYILDNLLIILPSSLLIFYREIFFDVLLKLFFDNLLFPLQFSPYHPIYLIFDNLSILLLSNSPILIWTILRIILLITYLMKDGLWEGKGIFKGAFKLRLVNTKTNKPVSKVAGFLRTFLSGLFAFYFGLGTIIDTILLFADKRGRRIADFILGTQVVDDELYTKMFLNQSK
jgi:serine/threonine protein kinase